MPFTLLDGIVLFVILISAVLAMIRGFTREVFSIGSWVAALVVAYFFWDDVFPYVQGYVDDKNIALGLTIGGLFFITLLIVSIITMRISDFVLDSRAGPLDRTLGFAFGAARGLLLVIIAILFLNFFIDKDKQPGWIATAYSKDWLDSLGTDLMNRLPDDPEARILQSDIIQRLRGESGSSGAPATSDEVIQEPVTPEGEPVAPAEPTPAPGIAPDDQNQLERELEAPPPD